MLNNKRKCVIHEIRGITADVSGVSPSSERNPSTREPYSLFVQSWHFHLHNVTFDSLFSIITTTYIF